jgi:hypothetical protein
MTFAGDVAAYVIAYVGIVVGFATLIYAFGSLGFDPPYYNELNRRDSNNQLVYATLIDKYNASNFYNSIMYASGVGVGLIVAGSLLFTGTWVPTMKGVTVITGGARRPYISPLLNSIA